MKSSTWWSSAEASPIQVCIWIFQTKKMESPLHFLRVFLESYGTLITLLACMLRTWWFCLEVFCGPCCAPACLKLSPLHFFLFIAFYFNNQAATQITTSQILYASHSRLKVSCKVSIPCDRKSHSRRHFSQPGTVFLTCEILFVSQDFSHTDSRVRVCQAICTNWSEY